VFSGLRRTCRSLRRYDSRHYLQSARFPSRMTKSARLNPWCARQPQCTHSTRRTPCLQRENVASDIRKTLGKRWIQLLRNGTMYRNGVDGRELHGRTSSLVVIYYIRLRHMGCDKYQVRSTVPIDQLTPQPAKPQTRRWNDSVKWKGLTLSPRNLFPPSGQTLQ